ncbi:leucine-rich repeat domain-containing protein [Colwellia psychrerythraea]|uniref:Leucine rich repeat domain protein n=1 Tax=Colwellia psychrerythraea (strain 34H / ATCC BAA-681) TaxID=167879 RepID=Q482I4_COLP3|nr:hypothetical protein [Colwellia psychrerythraea]AAZ26200.1 leucine rich repeat domain protein [Colwellia psychrerythraea 34H]
MFITSIRLFLLTSMLLGAVACNSDKKFKEPDQSVAVANLAPSVAINSELEVVEGQTLFLDGSESTDPENEALTYQWSQISGVSIALIGSDNAESSFIATEVDKDETLGIQLTATDPQGNSSMALFEVTIKNRIEISEIAFVDNNLSECVKALNVKYADQITELICIDKGIVDANEVAMLENLVLLNLTNNELKTIDISKNKALRHLWLGHNGLSVIDVTHNKLLEIIWLYFTEISEIDVSQNQLLTSLILSGKNLTSLNVEKNVELVDLYISFTSISTLDLNNNEKLVSLRAEDTPLTSIDISNNKLLEAFYTSINELTFLDLSQNVKLKELHLWKNKLASIDVSANVELTYLLISDNQLSSIDIYQNTKLTFLTLSKNMLSTVNVSQNTELTTLDLWRNNFTNLDVSMNTKLSKLVIRENPFFSCTNIEIITEQLPGIEFLYDTNCQNP